MHNSNFSFTNIVIVLWMSLPRKNIYNIFNVVIFVLHTSNQIRMLLFLSKHIVLDSIGACFFYGKAIPFAGRSNHGIRFRDRGASMSSKFTWGTIPASSTPTINSIEFWICFSKQRGDLNLGLSHFLRVSTTNLQLVYPSIHGTSFQESICNHLKLKAPD